MFVVEKEMVSRPCSLCCRPLTLLRGRYLSRATVTFDRPATQLPIRFAT